MLMIPAMQEAGLEPYPGFQRDFTFQVAVGIDTSGSVSDEDFKVFMSELLGIAQTEKGVSIILMMYDATIEKEFLLTDEEDVKKTARNRHGYGGTDFAPAMRRFAKQDRPEDWEEGATPAVNKLAYNPDFAIMLTDGYAPVDEAEGGPVPTYQPGCPLMWVICEDGKIHESMEKYHFAVQIG